MDNVYKRMNYDKYWNKHREVDVAVDKLQAFYKVNPIEKVGHTIRTGSDRHNSNDESKDKLEFYKCLQQYYNNKAASFQEPSQQKTNTYNARAVETLYEEISTVNFFG